MGRWFLGAVLWLMVTTSPVTAQTVRSLSPGAEVEGRLVAVEASGVGGDDVYRFTAKAGDRILLSLRGEAGFYPVLVIGRIDPAGRLEVLQETDDAMFSDGAATSKTTFVVPEAGDYVVRATSMLEREGPYTLTMGESVAAPSNLIPRSPSPATLAAREVRSEAFDAYVALLDRDVAACEASATWAGDCYDLLMEAVRVPRGVSWQWGGRALAPAEAAKTEAYARRAVAVARAAFTNIRREAFDAAVLDMPDYRIPNAEHALAVHLLTPIVDRPEVVATRAAEAERLLRGAYDAAAAHGLASGRRDLWNMDWLEHLALAMTLQGRQAEASVVLNERMAAAERTWGAGHGRLYQYLPALASGQMAAGDWIAATATWRQALSLAEVDGGVGSREQLDLRSGLAAALAGSGDLEAALDEYRTIQAGLASAPPVLESSIEGYVLGYVGVLQSLGRRQEAQRLLEQQMGQAAVVTGLIPEVLKMGLVAALNLMHLDRSDESVLLLEAITPLAQRVAGPDSQFVLRVETLQAVARANAGAADAAQAEVDQLLPTWRQQANGNPVLYATALEVFGDLRVAGGRAGEGRALLGEALPTELARWCPSHQQRLAQTGDYGWDYRDTACRGHPTLTAAVSMRAAAALRDGGDAGAATRGYAHAGNMVVGRTRARYSLHDDARREYGRFRGVHRNFVSAAWATQDRTVADNLARRPLIETDDRLSVADTLAALPSTWLRIPPAAIPIS